MLARERVVCFKCSTNVQCSYICQHFHYLYIVISLYVHVCMYICIVTFFLYKDTHAHAFHITPIDSITCVLQLCEFLSSHSSVFSFPNNLVKFSVHYGSYTDHARSLQKVIVVASDAKSETAKAILLEYESDIRI